VTALEVLGVPIAYLGRDEALARIAELVERDDPAIVAFANAHTLNVAHGDRRFRDVLLRSDLVLRDGIGLAIAARFARHRFPANLNGSDFTPLILELAANRGWSVFLLGGQPGVVERAAERLARDLPHLKVAGMHHGMFPVESELEVAEAIRDSGAEICLVGMGNPLQEYFLARYLQFSAVRLGVGVGAFFDFTSQRVQRAPAWVNKIGAEWVYRLALEPKRLWKRYVVGNPLFLVRSLGRVDPVRSRERD
jgi:exopolysaccharide biosynthesis WecB/TagA/CpsF family protein